MLAAAMQYKNVSTIIFRLYELHACVYYFWVIANPAIGSHFDENASSAFHWNRYVRYVAKYRRHPDFTIRR